MKVAHVSLLLVLLLTGCEDRKIKVYEIAKETPSTEVAGAQKPRWTVPPEWKELPPSGMRAASFSTSGKTPADISVVTFPGEAGGLLANLNRWRGQMKLEPATAADDLETLDAGGQSVQIVELAAPDSDSAMLGAIFLRADQSWFLKLTGSKAAIGQEREHFRQFAQSFRFDQPTVTPHSTNDG